MDHNLKNKSWDMVYDTVGRVAPLSPKREKDSNEHENEYDICSNRTTTSTTTPPSDTTTTPTTPAPPTTTTTTNNNNTNSTIPPTASQQGNAPTRQFEAKEQVDLKQANLVKGAQGYIINLRKRRDLNGRNVTIAKVPSDQNKGERVLVILHNGSGGMRRISARDRSQLSIRPENLVLKTNQAMILFQSLPSAVFNYLLEFLDLRNWNRLGYSSSFLLSQVWAARTNMILIERPVLSRQTREQSNNWEGVIPGIILKRLFQNTPRLRTIRLLCPAMDTSALSHLFRSCTHLTSLDLTHVPVQCEDLRDIKQCQNLKELRLGASRISVPGLGNILSNLPRLESLDIPSCPEISKHIRYEDFKRWYCPSLRFLNIRYVSHVSLRGLLQACPNLQWLETYSISYSDCLYLFNEVKSPVLHTVEVNVNCIDEFFTRFVNEHQDFKVESWKTGVMWRISELGSHRGIYQSWYIGEQMHDQFLKSRLQQSLHGDKIKTSSKNNAGMYTIFRPNSPFSRKAIQSCSAEYQEMINEGVLREFLEEYENQMKDEM